MHLTKLIILGGALVASASPVPTSSTLPYNTNNLESLLNRMLTEHDIGQVPIPHPMHPHSFPLHALIPRKSRDEGKGGNDKPPTGLLSNGKGRDVVIGPGGSLSVQNPTGEDGRGGVGFDGEGGIIV